MSENIEQEKVVSPPITATELLGRNRRRSSTERSLDKGSSKQSSLHRQSGEENKSKRRFVKKRTNNLKKQLTREHKSKSQDIICQHGKRVRTRSHQPQPVAPAPVASAPVAPAPVAPAPVPPVPNDLTIKNGDEIYFTPTLQQDRQDREERMLVLRQISMTSPEFATATANLITPARSTPSLEKPPPSEVKLKEVRMRTSQSHAGSLDRIRTDLHKLGVKTTNHTTTTRSLNVFDDGMWVEYSKNGDILVFDLGASEDTAPPERHTTLVCEMIQEEEYCLPTRGRGKYNMDWAIITSTSKDLSHPYNIGEYPGGLMCRRLRETKITAHGKDKAEAFKIQERTKNEKIQALIMKLGDTPEEEYPMKLVGEKDSQFYDEVDRIPSYMAKLESSSLYKSQTVHDSQQAYSRIVTTIENSNYDTPDNNSNTVVTNLVLDPDKEVEGILADQTVNSGVVPGSERSGPAVDSHGAGGSRPSPPEMDPLTCWPCVGCQDDSVPKSFRWCSVM